MENLVSHRNQYEGNNTTNVTTTSDVSTYSNHLLPLYIVLMVIIDVVGVLGNSLVLRVIMTKRQRMNTYTNWMILNLAVSDLLVTLFCIPLDIPLLVEEKWLYGKVFCKIYHPFGTAQLFSSVFTIVSIAYVRCRAVVFPFAKQPTLFTAKIVVFIIRLSSVLLVIPLALVLTYDDESQSCYEAWSEGSQSYYTILVFVVGYALPLLVISIGYSMIVYEVFRSQPESNSKTMKYKDKRMMAENRMLVRLSVAVTVTFGVCVLPNQIVFMLYTFNNLEMYRHHLDLLLGSHLLLFLNCAINPVVYNVFSEKFRDGFLHLFKSILRSNNDRENVSECRIRNKTFLIEYSF